MDAKRRLQLLQKNSSNIRNICILAHVDHGKTTLVDSLVASNGIISQRQAGKLRYMDSREDEQLRGITMKSSAIALHYSCGDEDYLINLIDSLGHVDFSSEVSTAVRLCDGAVVLVDAVEGVCPQTHTVLQQAWLEGIKPCLVINKIDRLISELQYTPTEAYHRLQHLLEQVNAITGGLFTSDVMEAAASKTSKASTGEKSTSKDQEQEEVVYDWSAGLEETDDSAIYFSPEQGNVVFASALDGWGFGVSHFAELYAKKLGIRAEILRKTLWGDFYLNAKAKRIFKGAQAKAKKPLFVQFVLENLWAVYNAITVQRDKAKVEKIVASLGLKISARDSRHTDPRVHLTAICSQWLPLAPAVLSMVTSHLPSPHQLGLQRVERLMCSSAQTFDSFPEQTQRLKKDFLACSPARDVPTIVFVSKLFCVDPSTLPQNQSRPLTLEEIGARREAAKQRLLNHTTEQPETQPSNGEAEKSLEAPEESSENQEPEKNKSVFLAFSRIYSGTLHKGQTVYVLQPRYDPREVSLDDGPETSTEENRAQEEGGHTAEKTTQEKEASPLEEVPAYVSKVSVSELYILMGRGVMEVDEVPAGNVLGIAGLDEHILKSATVASTLACPAFRAMIFAAAPILRVAVEPVYASDMPALTQGMRLLNQADASVEVSLQATGEHILSTAGEVHLQRCLDDLRDTFAKIELKVSAPIVPFRETIISPPKVDTLNEAISSDNVVRLQTNPLLRASEEGVSADGVVSIQTPNKACTLLVQAKPLPEAVTELLSNSSHLLKALHLTSSAGSTKTEVHLNAETTEKLRSLRSKLSEAFSTSTPSGEWSEFPQIVDRIWAFGPRSTGTNILLNGLPEYTRPSVWRALEPAGSGEEGRLREHDNSIVSGFQLATLAGPLCEEPLRGVCFIVRGWSYTGGGEVGRGEGGSRAEESQGEGVDPPAGSPDATNHHLQTTTTDAYGPFSGQLISAMKEGCRRVFLSQPSRLMSAMYTCDILATAQVLGKLYAVLGRRNGRVYAEEMREGSAMFSIQALIPVAESFGFAEEVRKKTSGLASPQLIFSHWEVIPSDPFWVPSSEEELLHYGEKADSENLARRYMNAVRKRKGLPVDEKLVEHGEKQRTLKKNK